jgi:hypothetical protein
MAGSRPALVRDVIVTIDGVTHRGTYFVRGKMVHVLSSFGNMDTQVGGSPPETLAKLLLSELVRSSS